jgi:hypothetical protein
MNPITNMNKITLGAALLLGVATLACAETDDAVEHFKGLPATTVDAAVTNFSEYNQRLKAVLDKETIDGADVAMVHELTYTLENALAKINEELTTLAETLEELHKASERADIDAVRTKGRAYLDVAGAVAP